MKKIEIIGTNQLLIAARNLVRKGELTPEQFNEMVRRNESLSQDIRENKIILEE